MKLDVAKFPIHRDQSAKKLCMLIYIHTMFYYQTLEYFFA